MYFALGILIMAICFVIGSVWDNTLYYKPKLTRFIEASQWLAFGLIVVSLIQFGIMHMW